MKIGLISINTRVVSLNFACPLHTYAFQQFLLKNGIETTIIDYKPIYYRQSFDPKHPLFFYLKRGTFASSFNSETFYTAKSNEEKNKIKGNQDLRRDIVKKWIDLFDEREIRYNRFQEFIDNNYIMTEKCYDQTLLDEEDPGFDCYICVTDVIWKDNPGFGFDKGFFLACKSMEGKKKIAYSASRGPFSGWSDETKQQFLNYIQPFDFISVRENSLKEYIESISDKKAEVVLDPVFLQNRDFYHKLAIPPKEKGYVLLYDVMEKATDSIIHAVRFAESKGLKLIELSDRMENAYIPDGTWHEVRYDLGIEEWLGYIEHADYIFTNSFHGSCFAIIFEKDFYVGKRNGDKVDMLLDTFELTHRRLDPETDVTTMPVSPIDYEPVRKILAEKKKASETFILNAIHSVEKDFQTKPDDTTKYRVFYHSGSNSKKVTRDHYKFSEKFVKTANGAWECQDHTLIEEDAPCKLKPNGFCRDGYIFSGWHGRITVEKQTLWYCTDRKFHVSKDISKKTGLDKYLFQDEEVISDLSFPENIQGTSFSFVMQAAWTSNKNDIARPTRHILKTKRNVQPKSNRSNNSNSTDSYQYRISYHSGAHADEVTRDNYTLSEKFLKTAKGAWECQDHIMKEIDIPCNLKPNGFCRDGYVFSGWNGRITVDQQTLWYCTDKNFHTSEDIAKDPGLNKYLFLDNEAISNLPFPESMLGTNFAFIMEAVWTIDKYYIIYHSGTNSSNLSWEYTEQHGTVRKTPKDCWEYWCNILIENGKPTNLQVNRFCREGFVFSGWNARISTDQNWWYCTDGTFHSITEMQQNPDLKKYIFYDAETVYQLPIPKNGSNKLVLEAIWKRG